MHSRAVLLLKRELRKFELYPRWGITANPIDENNLFEWEAAIRGPDDSHWEGGVFRVELIFPHDYDLRPPKVYFSTVPFHPNIDMQTGRPCVDFLDDPAEWHPEFDVAYILTSLQHMLPNPVLDNPVNTVAAHAYENAQSTYIDFVHECVAASRRVQMGLPPYEEEQMRSIAQAQATYSDDAAGRRKTKTATPARKTARVSYDDYFTLWRGVATSRTHSRDRELSRTFASEHVRKIHATACDMQTDRRVERHVKLIYGSAPFDRSAMKETTVLRKEHAAWVRDLYDVTPQQGGSLFPPIPGAQPLDRSQPMFGSQPRMSLSQQPQRPFDGVVVPMPVPMDASLGSSMYAPTTQFDTPGVVAARRDSATKLGSASQSRASSASSLPGRGERDAQLPRQDSASRLAEGVRIPAPLASGSQSSLMSPYVGAGNVSLASVSAGGADEHFVPPPDLNYAPPLDANGEPLPPISVQEAGEALGRPDSPASHHSAHSAASGLSAVSAAGAQLSAKGSARSSARESPRGSAQRSARESARESAHGSAHGSVHGSARESARGSAHDSGRASAASSVSGRPVSAGDAGDGGAGTKGGEAEDWENEVDELVTWTNDLDTGEF